MIESEAVAERPSDPAAPAGPAGLRAGMPAASTAPRTFRFSTQRLVLFLMSPALLLGLSFLVEGRSLPKGGIVFVGGVFVTWLLLLIGAAATLLLALLTGRRITRRQGIPQFPVPWLDQAPRRESDGATGSELRPAPRPRRKHHTR